MKKKNIGIGFLLFLFFIVMIFVITGTSTTLDDAIYNALIYARSNTLDVFFKGITKFGNTITILVFTIILLLLLKTKNRYILGIDILATVGTNQIIKHIIRRERPSHLRLISQGGYSFPSGHAMIAIALYGCLIYFIYKNIRNKYIKVTLITILALLIIGIGCSRIYVGVHYPTDILGGYSLALAILILVIDKVENHFRGNENEENGS